MPEHAAFLLCPQDFKFGGLEKRKEESSVKKKKRPFAVHHVSRWQSSDTPLLSSPRPNEERLATAHKPHPLQGRQRLTGGKSSRTGALNAR